MFLRITLTWKPNHIHCKTQQSLLYELPKHFEDNLIIRKNMKVFWRKYSLSIAMHELEVRERGLAFGLSRVHTGLSRLRERLTNSSVQRPRLAQAESALHLLFYSRTELDHIQHGCVEALKQFGVQLIWRNSFQPLKKYAALAISTYIIKQVTRSLRTSLHLKKRNSWQAGHP